MTPTENMPTAETIAGYTYGTDKIERSPVTLTELRQVEQAAGWDAADAAALRHMGELIRDDAEQLVDSWRTVIGEQPELARWFFGPDGRPDEQYKARVKKRFVQWVLDICFKPHDQAWLDYQDEIGKRHTPVKKNVTDGAATPSVVPLRYLVAFSGVVITSIREFLQRRRVVDADLVRFQQAWTKAVLLEIALWSRPYAKDGLW
jgi:Protoglobin